MSTTFNLLPVGGDESSVPSIDITETSALFDIDCFYAAAEAGDGIQWI